jgi:hypothetical protein
MTRMQHASQYYTLVLSEDVITSLSVLLDFHTLKSLDLKVKTQYNLKDEGSFPQLVQQKESH